MEMIMSTLIIAVVFTLIISRKGIIERLKSSKQKKEKILLEDALKYFYDCESVNKYFFVEAFVKHLSISNDKAEILLKKMESLGLIILKENKRVLSDEGKAYAIQIIRVHRLWENYLAEKTSLESSKWHIKADEAEHNISPDEANELAAKMGNPLFDPHGDPIPFDNGKVFSKMGKPLEAMNEDEFGQIIHIEDEPAEIYSQIAALQLYPGLNFQLIKKRKDEFRIKANGKEINLSEPLAKNITVAEIEENEATGESYETLASLNTGEEAEVVEIAKTCRGQQRRRLMDFGVVPGSKIKAELKSFGGNPVAYNIRGALIALRKENAEQIFIRKK